MKILHRKSLTMFFDILYMKTSSKKFIGLGQNVDKCPREIYFPSKQLLLSGGQVFGIIFCFSTLSHKNFFGILQEQSSSQKHFWPIYMPQWLKAGFLNKNRAEISAGWQKLDFFEFFLVSKQLIYCVVRLPKRF